MAHPGAKRPDLTIIIPAYAEEKRIGKTLDELATFLGTDPVLRKLWVETIVVSADSPDETHRIVRSKQPLFQDFKLLKPGPKVGKGRDVQYGVLRARGQTVLFMDADLATPLSYIPLFYERQQLGHDIVIATRNLLKHHPHFGRRLLSNTGNLLFRVAGGLWIEDSQCGFKMFTRDAAQRCFSKLSILGWGFDMEVLAIARAHKLRIACHRVDDWVSVPDGTFTDGFLENAVQSLKELVSIFWKRLRRTYVS